MTTVCHLSSAHRGLDVRIFAKECTSAARAGFDTHLVIQGSEQDRERAAASGVTLHRLDKPTGRFSRFVFSSFKCFLVGLRVRAQIYHFHDPELIPYGVILRLLGKRVVYDVHEDMPTVMYSKGWLPRWLRGTLSAVTGWTEWIAARYFFSIVTATPHIQQRFARANPTAVAINNFPIVAELGQRTEWDGKSRAVCYVGGIASIRGIREMVEAIGSVEPPATLLLAGAFVNPAERDEVRRRPGWERVEELGFLDRDGIRGVLARSMAGLVTLHPVPNYVDALPVKMFEYMCAGIPVVASDFPVWREIVAGSGCGLLVDPLDSHQVAAAIERLLADPEAARQMGERGRDAVLSKYSWEIEEQKLLALYGTLSQAWVPGRASP